MSLFHCKLLDTLRHKQKGIEKIQNERIPRCKHDENNTNRNHGLDFSSKREYTTGAQLKIFEGRGPIHEKALTNIF